jgi:uncharacterized YigZ family protein
MTEVRTVTGPVTAAIEPRKGSRFEAHLAPAGSAEEARAVVDEVRARHADATHHCSAWRLADGAHRIDDDGEPGGTAGAPILRHLDGAGLSDVVAVVTRWYGGTKLGTGGLVRAYGDATAAAIEAAEVVARPVMAIFELVHDYDLSGPVASVVAAHDATVVDVAYAENVTVHLGVPLDGATAFAADLAEATSGRVVAHRRA